jgi:hypothetical protein
LVERATSIIFTFEHLGHCKELFGPDFIFSGSGKSSFSPIVLASSPFSSHIPLQELQRSKKRSLSRLKGVMEFKHLGQFIERVQKKGPDKPGLPNVLD